MKYTGTNPIPPDAAEQTRRALRWQYSPERVALILSGQDSRTNMDLASWRRLGQAA